MSLFGFLTLEHRNFFLDLIGVKGIGPKSALLILAATDIEEFKRAIREKNINYLIKFPKIGKKSAQQIILDLESKYQGFENNLLDQKIKKANNDEVIQALASLGYDQKSINKVLPKLDMNLSIEEKIKVSLKMLIKI